MCGFLSLQMQNMTFEGRDCPVNIGNTICIKILTTATKKLQVALQVQFELVLTRRQERRILLSFVNANHADDRKLHNSCVTIL
jgi:hypothetical protein